MSAEESTEADGSRCGIFCWKPRCLQPLRRFLLLFLCLVLANSGIGLVGTYHNAMVSTFEKRFSWPTRTVGFILSSNDYGYLATVLFTAHFGGLAHRPRLMGICSFLYGFAGILYFLPYALFGSKFTTQEVYGGDTQGANVSEVGRIPTCLPPDNSTASAASPTASDDRIQDIQSNVAFGIFMLGGVIQGVAVGPYWNVAFALIDDMTKQWSGVFIGLYTLLRSFGPILGFQLGAATTKMNENLGGSLAQFAGTQKSPLWIGAWWLGYLLTGVVTICASLPLFCFPASVPLAASKNPSSFKNPLMRLLLTKTNIKDDILQQEETADPDSRKRDSSLAGFIGSLKRLSGNKIFLWLLVGNIFEFIGISTPANYGAKYFEHHFDVTQSEASSFASLTLPLGFGLGLFLSILVSFRFQMTMYGLARFHAFAHLFGVLRFVCGLLFTCPTPKVVMPTEWSACGNCSCSSAQYFPVCAGNVSHFSPCQLGCSGSLDSGCVCAPGGFVTRGTCEGGCYTTLIGYSIMFVTLGMLQSAARTQEAVINLRCVQPRDKALALASSSFMWGVTSAILPPILGSVFDSICLIKNADGARSYCEMYDRVAFKYAFHLLSICSQSLACVCFFMVWRCCYTRYGREGTSKTDEQLSHLPLKLTAACKEEDEAAEIKVQG